MKLIGRALLALAALLLVHAAFSGIHCASGGREPPCRAHGPTRGEAGSRPRRASADVLCDMPTPRRPTPTSWTCSQGSPARTLRRRALAAAAGRACLSRAAPAARVRGLRDRPRCQRRRAQRAACPPACRSWPSAALPLPSPWAARCCWRTALRPSTRAARPRSRALALAGRDGAALAARRPRAARLCRLRTADHAPSARLAPARPYPAAGPSTGCLGRVSTSRPWPWPRHNSRRASGRRQGWRRLRGRDRGAATAIRATRCGAATHGGAEARLLWGTPASGGPWVPCRVVPRPRLLSCLVPFSPPCRRHPRRFGPASLLQGFAGSVPPWPDLPAGNRPARLPPTLGRAPLRVAASCHR